VAGKLLVRGATHHVSRKHAVVMTAAARSARHPKSDSQENEKTDEIE
jgi:hypothetical protein